MNAIFNMIRHGFLVLASFFFISFGAAQNVEAGRTMTQVDIGETPWEVTFVDSFYDSVSNSTTFLYSVTVHGSPALSHIVFELPEEYEFVGFEGSEPVEILNKPDPTTGIVGIKYDGGQAEGTNLLYSFTLLGNWELGDINYSVKGATIFAIDTITGPVAKKDNPVNTYSISGKYFIDVDKNGGYNGLEPGLANVSVMLLDGNGDLFAVTVTDSEGNYTFAGLYPDNYSVTYPMTGNGHDVNGILSMYFTATGYSVRDIQVMASDINGVDFGFGVNTTSILGDLDAADADGDGIVLAGDGKTIGFWKHQLSVAIKGKGKAQIDAVTMTGYLGQIEGFYLVDPFAFGMDKFTSAFGVLSNTSSDATYLLMKQLLGTEFNEFAGRGLTGDYDALQTLLLHWGEYLVWMDSQFTREELLIAKDIFDGINNSGE